MGNQKPHINTVKVEELTLALMHLTTFQEGDAIRSWKGYDWDVLSRLHERGWISDPVSKAKSVVLTDEGVRRSRELFAQHFEELSNREHP